MPRPKPVLSAGMLEFAQTLKKKRLERGLSMRKLSALAKLSSQHVAQIEGLRIASVEMDTVYQLAHALQIGVYELAPGLITPEHIKELFEMYRLEVLMSDEPGQAAEKTKLLLKEPYPPPSLLKFGRPPEGRSLQRDIDVFDDMTATFLGEEAERICEGALIQGADPNVIKLARRRFKAGTEVSAREMLDAIRSQKKEMKEIRDALEEEDATRLGR